jgi:hypothetical protein
MDAGGRATHGAVAERAGVRRIKIWKMLYFDPLILTFSQWEKGHLSLT